MSLTYSYSSSRDANPCKFPLSDKTHVLCMSRACRRPRGPIADLTPPTPASRCSLASATLITASVFSCLAFCEVRGIGVPWFPQQRVMWRRHGRSGAARGHLWAYVCVLWSLVGLLPETGGADWWWVIFFILEIWYPLPWLIIFIPKE